MLLNLSTKLLENGLKMVKEIDKISDILLLPLDANGKVSVYVLFCNAGLEGEETIGPPKLLCYILVCSFLASDFIYLA